MSIGTLIRGIGSHFGTALTKKQCDTTDFNQVEEQIQKKYDCIINA